MKVAKPCLTTKGGVIPGFETKASSGFDSNPTEIGLVLGAFRGTEQVQNIARLLTFHERDVFPPKLVSMTRSHLTIYMIT